jgi:hypothetical protein
MARGGCLLKVVTMLACCLATGASAEVRVEGNLTALRVSASGDSLSNVLLAFGTLSPVRLRAAIPLNAEIKATYSGSLSQVVSRLLDGYNYVIKNEDGLTEILVLGNAGEVAIPPKARLVKGALSRWR